MRTDRARWFAVLIACSGCAFADVAPYPYDDHVTLREDEAARIDVLENDLGAERVENFLSTTDSTGKRVDIGKRTQHGEVRVLDDGTVLYTPDRDFAGTDRFDYVASNAGGNTRARVTIEVLPDSAQFGEPIVLHELEEPMHLWPAALDGDGRPDVVLLEPLERKRIELLRNAGDLSFEPLAGCCDDELFVRELLVVDLDRDGLDDLVQLGGAERLAFHRNRRSVGEGEPRFEREAVDFEPRSDEVESSPSPLNMAVGKIDGNDTPDLVLGFGSGARGRVLFNAGVESRQVGELDLGGTTALAVGDVTGDGADDVIALNHTTLQVFHEELELSIVDSRASSASVVLLSITSTVVMRVADLDGNGMGEIVIADGAQLTVLTPAFNGEQLTFEASELEVGVRDFALADVDGDGFVELLTTEDSRRGLVLYRSAVQDGRVSFERAGDFAVYSLGMPLHVIDMTGDGLLDVLAVRCPQDLLTCEVIAIPGIARP